jgi:hypothetical protein
MTDVYVALRRLKRRGKAARILPGKPVAPTFAQTWAKVDGLATMFPDRVTRRGADA